MGLLAAPLIVFGCAAHDTHPTATTFGKRYAVSFPEMPSCEATVQEAPGLRASGERCSYFDEQLHQGLAAEYITFMNAIPPQAAAQLLSAAAQGAATASDSRLISQKAIAVGSYPALDVTFYPNTKGFVAFGRYILVGSDLVMVTADGFKTTTIPEYGATFFESLAIRP